MEAVFYMEDVDVCVGLGGKRLRISQRCSFLSSIMGSASGLTLA
jgi:hypothetical protein